MDLSQMAATLRKVAKSLKENESVATRDIKRIDDIAKKLRYSKNIH